MKTPSNINVLANSGTDLSHPITRLYPEAISIDPRNHSTKEEKEGLRMNIIDNKNEKRILKPEEVEKALYIIDMNNGFVNFGAMANPSYNALIP